MKDMWIRIRKFDSEGDHPGEIEVMYESRCDMFPDAAMFADTADKAYEEMTMMVPEMMEHYFETFGKLPYAKEEDNE